MKRLILAISLLLVGLVVPASAMREGPIRVRIVGYVGAIPDGVRHQYKWRLTYQNKEYLLYVVKLDVINTNMIPNDIDQAVKPSFSRFDLYGQPSVLTTFTAVPPKQETLIFAFVSLGDPGPSMSLDTVEPYPQPTPEATAAAPAPAN